MSSKNKYEDMRKLFYNEYFELDHWFQNLMKFERDAETLKLLIERLKDYPLIKVKPFLIELLFFSLLKDCPLLDQYLVGLCGVDFAYYFQISTGYEVWGRQFWAQDPAKKARISSLLEECEAKWVNSVPPHKSASEDFPDLQQLQNLIGYKNAKNDLKDSVRKYIERIIRFGLSLPNFPREECHQRVQSRLQLLNFELLDLFEQRSFSPFKAFYQGLVLPFKSFPESNVIVRIIYEETHVFPTRERVPFLFCCETVSMDDAQQHLAKREKDIDFFRWKHKMTHRTQPLVTEAQSPTDLRAEGQLLMFHAEQNELLKRISLIESVRTVFGRSKSVPGTRFPKATGPRAAKPRPQINRAQLGEKLAFIDRLLNVPIVKNSPERVKQLQEHMHSLITNLESLSRTRCPGVEGLSSRINREKNVSPYREFPSYCFRAYIFKAGEDMRQEYLIIHFLTLLRKYALKENAKIFLCDLDFIILSRASGMVEFLRDTFSVDHLKKIYRGSSLLNIYREKFADRFEEAQKNFVKSLAGYSFICYLFNIKDRHNGNILIDPLGHIIHIDFGFCLGSSPRNLNFESAPFKMTQDYLDIMEGEGSFLFSLFKARLIQMFGVVKKYADPLWALMEIMMHSNLNCFKTFDFKGFKSRFHCFLSDTEVEKLVEQLIQSSFNSMRTSIYDKFQKYSNNIES